MDRYQDRSSVGIKICISSQITRLFLGACLLFLFVCTQAQDQTSPPPKTAPRTLDTFVTLKEIDMGQRQHMRFCDTEKPIYDDDIFCNRVIAMVNHGYDEEGAEAFGTGEIVNAGIFIDNRRILTSYTPYRVLRRHVPKDKIYVNYIIAKAFLFKVKLVGYYFNRMKLACARQIVAMEENLIVADQWHGAEHTHSPLHDLMIFKVEEPVTFIANETWERKHVTLDGKNVTLDLMNVGPMETKLAAENDEFPESFRIITLGFMDNDHVFNKNHLHTSKDYETEDRILEDCEEWFPRDWGYYFCVRNDEDFVGIGSGSILVGSEKGAARGTGKVFGIGSFMLKKNKASILVFTDIRPYLDALNMTCNGWDGN